MEIWYEDKCFGSTTDILRNIPVWKLTQLIIILDIEGWGCWQHIGSNSNVLYMGQNTRMIPHPISAPENTI